MRQIEKIINERIKAKEKDMSDKPDSIVFGGICLIVIRELKEVLNEIKGNGVEVWNVYYFSKEGVQIDQTQIDEKNEELAWDLFKEFGHKKEQGYYLEWEMA